MRIWTQRTKRRQRYLKLLRVLWVPWWTACVLSPKTGEKAVIRVRVTVMAMRKRKRKARARRRRPRRIRRVARIRMVRTVIKKRRLKKRREKKRRRRRRTKGHTKNYIPRLKSLTQSKQGKCLCVCAPSPLFRCAFGRQRMRRRSSTSSFARRGLDSFSKTCPFRLFPAPMSHVAVQNQG